MLREVYEVLKKYEGGEYVDERDRPILDEWASIGRVSYGYSLQTDCETAKLTGRGKRWLKREEIRGNPVKKFFYKWINNLS